MNLFCQTRYFRSYLLLAQRRYLSETSHVPLQEKEKEFMKLAIRHAQYAYRENNSMVREVPIGAVVVDSQGTVLAASRNRIEELKDCTAHAELDALRKAAEVRGDLRLLECTLFTTLEPCPMCLGAIQNFRVKRIVFGAKDLLLGACGSKIDLISKHPFHQLEVTGGVLSDESTLLLRRFFQLRRREQNKPSLTSHSDPIANRKSDPLFSDLFLSMDRGMEYDPVVLPSGEDTNYLN